MHFFEILIAPDKLHVMVDGEQGYIEGRDVEYIVKVYILAGIDGNFNSLNT